MLFQRNQIYPFLHEWIDEFLDFSNRLHIVNIDLSSFACVVALMILNPELKDLEDREKILNLRRQVEHSLYENCRTNENVSDRQGYREKVLMVIQFVHEVSLSFLITKSCFNFFFQFLENYTPTSSQADYFKANGPAER